MIIIVVIEILIVSHGVLGRITYYVTTYNLSKIFRNFGVERVGVLVSLSEHLYWYLRIGQRVNFLSFPVKINISGLNTVLIDTVKFTKNYKVSFPKKEFWSSYLLLITTITFINSDRRNLSPREEWILILSGMRSDSRVQSLIIDLKFVYSQVWEIK